MNPCPSVRSDVRNCFSAHVTVHNSPLPDGLHDHCHEQKSDAAGPDVAPGPCAASGHPFRPDTAVPCSHFLANVSLPAAWPQVGWYGAATCSWSSSSSAVALRFVLQKPGPASHQVRRHRHIQTHGASVPHKRGTPTGLGHRQDRRLRPFTEDAARDSVEGLVVRLWAPRDPPSWARACLWSSWFLPWSLMAPALPEVSPRPKGAAEGRGAGAPGAKQRAMQLAPPQVGPSAPLMTSDQATTRGCQSPRWMTREAPWACRNVEDDVKKGWPCPSRCGLGNTRRTGPWVSVSWGQARHR